MKRTLKWIGIALAVLIVIAAAGALWLLETQSGAGFALERAKSALAGKLSVGAARGTLVSPLELNDVRWRDPAAGIDVHVDHLRIAYAIGGLLQRRLRVTSLEVDGVEVALRTVAAAPAAPQPPLRQLLTPPLDITVDRAHVAGVTVAQDGKPAFAANTIDLAAAWTASALRVRQLAVRAPEGHIDLSGALESYANWQGHAQADLDWKVDTRRIAARIDLSDDGRRASFSATLAQPMAATASGTLVPDASLPWTLAVNVPAFDPAPLTGSDSVQQLALALEGSGDRNGGTLAGRIEANAHRVLIDPLKFAIAGEELTIQNLHLRTPEAPGTLTAKGTVQLDAQPLAGALSANWEGVELPADLVGQVLATQGTLNATGSAQRFDAQADLSIGPPGKPAHFTLDLAGTPQAIDLHKLQLEQPHGGLAANGSVTLQPQVAWKIDAHADQLDTGALVAAWPGSLSFALATSGQMQADGAHGTLALEHLSGTLRQRPLRGGGTIAFAPPLTLDGAFDLASGASQVQLRGKGGKQTDATVQLEIASLGDWLPHSSGSLHGTIAARGTWPRLAVDADLQGAKLAYGDTTATALALQAHAHDVPDAPGGTLDLKAESVSAGGRVFDTLTLNAHGDEGAHELQFAAHAPSLDASLTLNGALTRAAKAGPAAWRGALSQLTLKLPDVAPWTQADPAALSYADAAFTLGELCLQSGQPRLCLSADSRADGAAQAKYTLQQLPLAMIVALVAPDAPLRVTGQIDGSGTITRTAAGALDGHAALTSAAGSVFYPDEASKPLLAYHAFNVDAALAPQQGNVTIAADFDSGGQLRGHVTLGGGAAGAMPLGGEIDVRVDDLHVIDLLTTKTASTSGKLDAHLALAGTTADPRVSGRIALNGFATEIPDAGLKLDKGEIALQSNDGRTFEVSGTIASGGGTLTASGTAGLGEAPLALKIEGENFLAADIPGAQVRITPNLSVRRDDKRYVVRGEVTIPHANVDLSKLPGGSGVATVSPDVVITDAQTAPQTDASASLPLSAVVTIKLGAGETKKLDLRQGRDVHLVGFGLDGYLSGQLTVQDRPGKPSVGRGQIEVNGTYKAYGQDLTIQQGRLLFATTPLDNPGLDIRATRAFADEDVTVGLQVRGTAQAPELSVFSTPAMEQSDALSYLVAGKPLSQLRGGEGNAVSSAARALGTAGGDLLAKSIGSRLGIDEIGVAENSSVGGAALTVGKYLSPRLYLSYGVGLFTPGEVITLRYRLTQHFDAEVQNGTLSNRAGINYKIEK
jgi:translocation and assembly module TamB